HGLPECFNMDSLLLCANQETLHGPGDRIVRCKVTEIPEIKIGTELTVKPCKYIQIKLGSNAMRIVVSFLNDVGIFLQVESYQEHILAGQRKDQSLEELRSLFRSKVAN